MNPLRPTEDAAPAIPDIGRFGSESIRGVNTGATMEVSRQMALESAEKLYPDKIRIVGISMNIWNQEVGGHPNAELDFVYFNRAGSLSLVLDTNHCTVVYDSAQPDNPRSIAEIDEAYRSSTILISEEVTANLSDFHKEVRNKTTGRRNFSNSIGFVDRNGTRVPISELWQGIPDNCRRVITLVLFDGAGRPFNEWHKFGSGIVNCWTNSGAGDIIIAHVGSRQLLDFGVGLHIRCIIDDLQDLIMQQDIAHKIQLKQLDIDHKNQVKALNDQIQVQKNQIKALNKQARSLMRDVQSLRARQ